MLYNYLWTRAKLHPSRLECNTVISKMALEPQLMSYILLSQGQLSKTKTLSGMGDWTLTCIPNILHQQLHKWVWMFTYSEIPARARCKPQQNLLQRPLLKGEGHSAHCHLLPVLYWFSRRILSMKTVRIPNWNSFQRRLTFSMAQQFSLLRKAILFQSEEGVYYFRI